MVLDMSPFITPKSNQLTADDLLSGDRTITITGVDLSPGAEQPCRISFEGDDGKPWYPCKSMGRVLVKAWGPDAKQYVGKSLRLFRDPEVTWAGMKVGGIRIRALSHIDAPFDMALTATRGKKAMARFLPLKDAPASQGSEEGDPAKDWADKFIATLSRAPDLEKLNAFIEKSKSHLTTLESDRPELHKVCDEAVTAARKNFDAADDDPFADAPTNFGGFVEGITARIEAAETAEALDEISEDIGKVNLPDDEVANLDVAISKKRRALLKVA